MWMWNMLNAQWTGWEEEKKNPYSWHNIISTSLLESNHICKDRGGINYQQLGWNDNTHYTAISLHTTANGSNHSTLINKTLHFVSNLRSLINLSSRSPLPQPLPPAAQPILWLPGREMSIATSGRVNTTPDEVILFICLRLEHDHRVFAGV